MTDDENHTTESREGLARFLAAALSVFRHDAEAAGMKATATALDQAMSAIEIDVPVAIAQ